MAIGGLVDESGGRTEGRRIKGTILLRAVEGYGQFWVVIEFGRGNVLVLSTYLVQIMEPFSLRNLGLDIGAFEVMAIQVARCISGARLLRSNGFAKTILLVEPTEPFLGTVRLDKLPYENVDLKRYYPYGNPDFAWAAIAVIRSAPRMSAGKRHRALLAISLWMRVDLRIGLGAERWPQAMRVAAASGETLLPRGEAARSSRPRREIFAADDRGHREWRP